MNLLLMFVAVVLIRYLVAPQQLGLGMSSYPTEECTYPDSEWAKLSPEDKAFMREAKERFGKVKYESEKGPEGVLVFPETEWESRGYWK